ncbi:hypothetical protein [Sphingomonas sp.]
MQHDVCLRAAARAIYDTCYPGEEWSPLSFDEAERFGTVHYRQAVGAAQQARAVLNNPSTQPALFASLEPRGGAV